MHIQPIFSIIVPCYNVRNYLQKCVDSLISQIYHNIEIILVDDGSTDGTSDICDEYANKDSRIKVIHKENGGLVSARNSGYNVATGEWLMYLDGDDWIDTNTCEKLINYISDYPDIDIIFWKYIQELDNTSIKGKMEWPCKEKLHLYSNDECKELAYNTLIYKSGIATAYCKLIRLSYAKKYNIYHDKRLRQGAEGIEFSLRAFYYAGKALYVNEYFNHYRYNPNSISKQVNETNTKYLIDCFRIIEYDIENFENKEIFKEALYQRIVYVLIAIAMSTYFHPANKDCLLHKIRKYKQIIESNPLFKESIKKAKIVNIDKLRKIAFFFIRIRMYFVLQIIASLKQYYFKKGKFNY